MTVTSSGDNDPRNRPKELDNTSEQVSQCVEQRVQENIPEVVPDDPDKLEHNVDVLNGLPSTREGPAQHRSDHIDETSTIC